MIRVQGLEHRLTSGGREVSILNGIDLQIRKGEFVSIIGQSGSGKTTLLSLLAGLDTPTSGNIVLNGTSLTGLSENKMALLRGSLIGFIFQSFQIIPTLTALENVALSIELNHGKSAEKRAEQLLTKMGLKERLHHYPLQLSGGEQQRVAVARAFACTPPIIFADEPTGNLDSTTGGMIIDLILKMRREHNTTLILVTHDAELAKKSDRIITLVDGRITADNIV